MVEPGAVPADQSIADEPFHEPQTAQVDLAPTAPSIDTVALLPWHGPFEWNGVIVAAAPQGIALGLFDPYREPLGRLTDRLAVALEFQHSDAMTDAAEQRATRDDGLCAFPHFVSGRVVAAGLNRARSDAACEERQRRVVAR